MAENLGGISEDVSALIRAINAALPQSNTKKTVDIKVNGAKELKEAADSVKTFGAAVKTLDESGVDRVTKSVGSIMGLLSGKLRNAPVSSITTSLIDVFTKPDASAKELLDTVLEVQSELENVQRLSKKIDVSLLTSSQLNSLLSRQSKIDEIRYEFSSDKKSRKSELRREAYQKYEDIDVYKMARGSKSGKKQTAKEIAANIGINPDDVTSADAEQLQTYIRTLDLLKQLIDARKEYGEIHSSADANNYLKQEQQISKVYQEVLKQESAIRDKFKVKGDPLSSAFELDQQTVKANAQQAAEAYVNWFMRTLQTQLNNAIADLDTRVTELQGNIEKRTEQSAQRVEKNTKFARGRRNGGSGSGSGGTGEGTGDGTGGTGSGGGETGGQVPAVTPKTDGVDAAKQQIEKYILTIDECIDKINELNKKKFDFDPDSDEYLDIVDQQALYFARIQKLNSEAKKKISDKELSDRIGGDDYDEIKYQAEMIAKGAADKDVKQQYDALLAYVDSNPVTVKVETGEAKKKTDEIKKTINDLAEQAKDIEFGAVFDSRTGKSSKTYSGKDKQIDLAEAYADAKKSGIQADTYFHTHPDAAKYAAFSLKDIETSIAAVKDGIRQSVLMVGDEVATMDVGSLAGLGQDFLDKFYSAISAHVTDGLNQLRENIAQNLSYGDVIDNLPLITKQLQDELKEALSSYNLTSRDVDIIQPVINAGIDQVSQKLLELVKSGEKLQGRTLINDQIQSIIDNILNSVKSSIVSSGIKIDPNILGDIMSDTFGSLDAVFDQDKFKKMFAKENLPIDKMALIQQKAISDALLQLGKEPEDFYKILTKDQYLGQVYDGENPKSKLHIDVSEAVNEINALKEVVASLKEQIQQLSETKVVVDVDELQARLERAQEEIDELNHALAGTVSESSNNFLSEQLSEAEQHIRELGEEVASLRQQLTDVQQKAQQAPLDMGALDKKVTELQYLHDKVRTIFDGKDGIINEDMTYDEKFNSAEVQRMIELLSQLTDAELKATMGIEGDEWVAEFRNNLQTEINLIRELQKEQQKVYDGTWPEDMEEPDLAIWRHLENIYDIVNNVTRQFESKLTPSVREFMSLLEGQVGADGMFSFLNGQNIDRYINDILSGAKTAKEAFADLENAFGWDTDRFASLIDGEVPEELKGLYDQLFSDVENRIKTAEQAAEEFNSKLREMQAQAQEATNPSSDGAISDDIIEQVAQAHRDAAEAAKQHAAEEQAAADATKNVVDAAGAQKVPGKEQPSINPENTGEAADMSALGDAVNAVTKAVDDKTMAFSREAQTVQESVQMEIASLQRLIEQLEAIRDLGQNLPKIQLSGKDGTKANPIISPELIKSIEQLKTAVGDFDPQKLTELFVSIKNLKINDNISTRMTELATGFLDLKEALDGWEGNAAKTLEMITQLSQKASALKDVIKTANDQNVKKPKDQKSASEKNEPAKPAEKSKDEIRADQLKAYNAALKEFQALENARVRTGQSVDKLGAETLSKRVQLTNQLDSIQKAWNDDAAKGVAKTKEMLAAEQQRLVNAEEIEAAESKRWNEQVKKSINFSNLQSRTTKLKAEKDLRPDAFGARYEEIEKKAKELSLLFPLKPFDEDAAQNARDMAEELDKMITETRNAPEYKLAKDNYVSGLGRKMETWAANNGRAVAANKGAWEKIQEEFKQIDTLADGQNVSKMFDEFVAGANRAGQAGETFTQGLMKRFKSLGQYLLSFASFYRVIGVFKQVYGTVKELDDALVEMRKVSDESLSSLQRYQSLSFNMADEVGTTAQQIQQSTADWLRLGESFEEAQKSAKESTILLNVSEFENIDKATEALVSASQAYKDLDKIDIIDKLNNIGNNFSISTDQLATGLQNAAAVLMTQGNDIDEALALLTAGKALPENTEMYLLEYI